MTAIIDYGVGNLFSLKSSFAAIGADLRLVTEDGSLGTGTKGFVTDALREELPDCRYVMACGPSPMLRAF